MKNRNRKEQAAIYGFVAGESSLYVQTVTSLLILMGLSLRIQKVS